MIIEFYKYQGTGNDFVILDNRDGRYNSLSQQQVLKICDRRFGVGGDGLMLLQLKDGYDFEMIYYNADGKEGSMCGNGGRCLVSFAKAMGVINNTASFIAVDGLHEAAVLNDGRVKLKMQDVSAVERAAGYSLLNTGSPHYISFQSNINSLDVNNEGKKIRYSKRFANEGVNVNFAEYINNTLYVRTYERGVENETLSCGTGVTAAAIAASGKENRIYHTNISTPGGKLQIEFIKVDDQIFKDVYLTGPAELVFKGTIAI